MDFYTEIKLRPDAYNGSFSNGLTMTGSRSLEHLEIAEEGDNCTVYTDARGYRLESWHIQTGAVVECKSVFLNESETPVTIEMISSFALRGLKADRIHRLQSFWSAEGRLLSQNLVDLNMEPSWGKFGVRVERFGQTGSMPVRKWFPFLAVEDSRSGTFTAVQIYCPSSWQMEIFREDEPVSLAGGLADYDFGHWYKTIEPGESFETPKAVVAQGRSLEEVCDKLVKAQHPRIAVPDKDMPIIFNEYCTTWGNPTLENLTKTAQRIENTPIRYLVIDAGWYKKPEGDWFEMVGDWEPSRELFPNGIQEAANILRSHGLIPGLWFEMEVAARKSRAYQMEEHLLKKNGVTITSGTRRFWDMEDPWVQQYLTEKVIGFLRDNGFGYLKVDYNENIGMGCDGAESLGEGLRRKLCATQNFFRKIAAELPDLVIENCSSGGHRLEPSMMELVSQASFSDAHECTSIPVIAANLHRVIRPEQSQIWAVLHPENSRSRLHYLLAATFLGRMCLSGPVFELEDWQWQEAVDAMDLYKTVSPVIRDGYTQMIACTTTSYDDLTGWQGVLRVCGDKALLVVHTFKNGAHPPVSEWTKGYTVIRHYGDELNEDFQAAVYFLEKTREP